MIMYDQDPDILSWGLNILHVEPYPNYSYCGTTAQNDAHFYDGVYTKEINFDTESICVENDEILAHALQEEFSQLAVAEATGPSHAGEEHSQASVLTQDWFVPSMTNFYSVNVFVREEADEVESSSSCSTPGEISYEWEELELYDDSSTLDGEVGKRLNQMISIPHVPRINGEIPSVDEATSDHQRLLDSGVSSGIKWSLVEDIMQLFTSACVPYLLHARSLCCNLGDGERWMFGSSDLQSVILRKEPGNVCNIIKQTIGNYVVLLSLDFKFKELAALMDSFKCCRLQLYDLVELKVQGDGNCQFRALSDQFYRTPEHHKFVRQQVLNQLMSHPENYEGYVPMAYNDYLKKLSTSGEWGDHVTLQAAADSYGLKIFVITSFKDTCYIEILPSQQRSKRVIFMSFWAEVHYNSIYPEGDRPTSETRKKRWWRFGNKY